jgi:hypothetical protein
MSAGGSYCDDWEIDDDRLGYDDEDYEDEDCQEWTEEAMVTCREGFDPSSERNDCGDDGGDDDDDDSDTDGEMGVRALAFDPNQLSDSKGLPVNGHDYLKMVQEEREKLPAIVSVPPPPSAKKSTQSTTIHMDVFHCDEEIFANQENCMPSQQSSCLPMDTSVIRDQHISSPSSALSSSSDEDQDHHNNSIYSGMASREFRNQLRLKSIGCTPLNIERSKQNSDVSNGERELIHRDQILANFLRLRSQIDSIRGNGQAYSGNKCDTGDNDDDDDNEEPKKQKGNGKQTNKNMLRCERRVASLLRTMNLGHPPQLSTLVHKSQRVIHLTLERLADQCEKSPIYSTLHADWIYSLIALLREPIEPDICSTLRRLAKLCIIRRDGYERRQTMNGTGQQQGPAATSKELVDAINDEEYYACLLIICIIRYHFGQADLK